MALEPAESERDIAVEAIVYDDHPALTPEEPYPYAVQPAVPWRPVSAAPFLSSLPPAPVATTAQYVVPKRFGMAAIVGIVTALAVLFGILRFMDAHPAAYLFFGTQSLLICLVQMFHGRTPRLASALAGAVILPVFLFLTVVVASGRPQRAFGPSAAEYVCILISSVPIGAFVGYLTGTLAAGIFLVMDVIESLLTSATPGNSREQTCSR